MLVAREPTSYRHYTDCGKCMSEFPLHQRQLMGCGWAPAPPDGYPVHALDAEGRLPFDLTPEEHEARRNKVCPGYTCGLPEVVEASRARAWAEKRGLRDFTKGEQPSDELMLAIDILDVEHSRATEWAIKNPKKDG